jgi:hypothetical protein
MAAGWDRRRRRRRRIKERVYRREAKERQMETGLAHGWGKGLASDRSLEGV